MDGGMLRPVTVRYVGSPPLGESGNRCRLQAAPLMAPRAAGESLAQTGCRDRTFRAECLTPKVFTVSELEQRFAVDADVRLADVADHDRQLGD